MSHLKSSVRSIATVTVIVAVSAGAFFLARREAMKRGYIEIDKYDIRSEGILQEGDLAPDLELERLDGTVYKGGMGPFYFDPNEIVPVLEKRYVKGAQRPS